MYLSFSVNYTKSNAYQNVYICGQQHGLKQVHTSTVSEEEEKFMKKLKEKKYFMCYSGNI